jgi:hypothetical protein
MAQKVVQYQAALQLAQTAPQLYDLPLLHRQMLDVLGIKNYQKLVPMPEDMKPRDPVSENQNILMNKPVKAFISQDHQAHITVHMSMAQDPHIQQLVSQNPQLAQQIQAELSAHVAEHLGMEYRKQMEQRMGMVLPPMPQDQDDEEPNMPPEVEAQISQMAAQAATQMLQQHQQQAQQAQAQQQAQDPIIQLQQQEVMIKAQEQQRKAKKDQDDFILKQQQLALEKLRIEKQQETEGAKMAIQTTLAKRKAQDDQMVAGAEMAMDFGKHQTQLAHQKELATMQHEAQRDMTRMNQAAQKQTEVKKETPKKGK